MNVPGAAEILGLEGPQAAWPDERLVAACLSGEEEAWEALIQKYKRLIYSIPFRYGATAEDAADIFQAVCVELYAELPRLRKVDSLRSWLMTVTARQSLRSKKQRAKHSGVDVDELREGDPATVETAAWMAETERAQMVGEAMEMLSERCRTLVKRLFFEDPPKPYEALAKELGLAVGSIGFNRGRCLDKLRKALEELGC